jgi:hypothetical protein
MRMRSAFALALAATFAAACGGDDDGDLYDGQPGEDLTTPAPAPGQPADVAVASGQFESTGDAPGQPVTGTAELRRRGENRDDGLELRVMLMGLTGDDHAWHIHQGACGSVGPVVVALSEMDGRDNIGDDLDPDDSGHVEETVNLDGEHLAALTPNQSYSVNVHQRGGRDHGPAIACATLNLPSDLWGAGY